MGLYFLMKNLRPYHYLGTVLVFFGVYLAKKIMKLKRRNFYLEFIIESL
jgi:drug/metabolite transporter (DMT)-like permease